MPAAISTTITMMMMREPVASPSFLAMAGLDPAMAKASALAPPMSPSMQQPMHPSAPSPIPEHTYQAQPQGLLNLLAWLSPGFPTGAFAYSHGLEWAVEAGDISDANTLQAWVADILTYGSGRNDAILLRHAYRAACNSAALDQLAAFAAAIAPSRERLTETLDQGTAFLRAVQAWGCPEMPDPIAYPVAVGALAGWHRIEEHAIAAAYVQAFASNLISAAVRLIPLGQTAGLQVLAAIQPSVLRTAHETAAATLDDIGGCAFRADLASMLHENQYTRLFRT